MRNFLPGTSFVSVRFSSFYLIRLLVRNKTQKGVNLYVIGFPSTRSTITQLIINIINDLRKAIINRYDNRRAIRGHARHDRPVAEKWRLETRQYGDFVRGDVRKIAPVANYGTSRTHKRRNYSVVRNISLARTAPHAAASQEGEKTERILSLRRVSAYTPRQKRVQNDRDYARSYGGADLSAEHCLPVKRSRAATRRASLRLQRPLRRPFLSVVPPGTPTSPPITRLLGITFKYYRVSYTRYNIIVLRARYPTGVSLFLPPAPPPSPAPRRP